MARFHFRQCYLLYSGKHIFWKQESCEDKQYWLKNNIYIYIYIYICIYVWIYMYIYTTDIYPWICFFILSVRKWVHVFYVSSYSSGYMVLLITNMRTSNFSWSHRYHAFHKNAHFYPAGYQWIHVISLFTHILQGCFTCTGSCMIDPEPVQLPWRIWAKLSSIKRL